MKQGVPRKVDGTPGGVGSKRLATTSLEYYNGEVQVDQRNPIHTIINNNTIIYRLHTSKSVSIVAYSGYE